MCERKETSYIDPSFVDMVQKKAEAEQQLFMNSKFTPSQTSYGAAMEPTLVNNLLEEINRLETRLTKLRTVLSALQANGCGNIHGNITIY